MAENSIAFNYTFTFEDKEQVAFNINLDDTDLRYLNAPPAVLPEWTKLAYHQCPNCTLDLEKHAYCPVAVNLVETLEKFQNVVSHTQAHISIKTEDRTYAKTDSIQRGISSLLGILMPTSGCPVLDKLRPMVRTHLPFSSMKETLYRVISMFIMAQHFRERRNLKADYSLEELKDIFDDVTVVNHTLCERVRSFFAEDANINALVILSVMAEFTSVSLKDDLLDELEGLFGAYYNED
jgi:hypothetical protein